MLFLWFVRCCNHKYLFKNLKVNGKVKNKMLNVHKDNKIPIHKLKHTPQLKGL